MIPAPDHDLAATTKSRKRAALGLKTLRADPTLRRVAASGSEPTRIRKERSTSDVPDRVTDTGCFINLAGEQSLTPAAWGGERWHQVADRSS
jgi:hypothetical protein